MARCAVDRRLHDEHLGDATDNGAMTRSRTSAIGRSSSPAGCHGRRMADRSSPRSAMAMRTSCCSTVWSGALSDSARQRPVGFITATRGARRPARPDDRPGRRPDPTSGNGCRIDAGVDDFGHSLAERRPLSRERRVHRTGRHDRDARIVTEQERQGRRHGAAVRGMARDVPRDVAAPGKATSTTDRRRWHRYRPRRRCEWRSAAASGCRRTSRPSTRSPRRRSRDT